MFCKADGIQINLTVQGVSPGAALISMKLFFQGSLPLLMMFDLPDDILIDDGCVQGLQEELDVSITIKPKSRQANKTVIIRTQERNASAIYRVCHNFFHIFGPPVTVPFTQLNITIVCSPLWDHT